MKLLTAVAAAAFATISPAAWSAPTSLTQEYDRCVAHADSSDPRLQECAAQEYERQDRRLNVDYQHLLKLLTPAKADELRKVQRAWLVYVGGKCDFWFDSEDFRGTMDRLMANECAMRSRADRADELEELIHHQGG